METTWIFRPEKLHPKKCGNNEDFLTMVITSKKLSEKIVDILTSKFMSRKVHGDNVDFLTSKITPKKVPGKNMNFSTIKLHCKKYVEMTWFFFTIYHFSISKITLKKYVEMTWKFVKTWSLTYRLNIDVVCPMRFLSIPRLELTAAVLPVKMAYLIRKKLNLGTVAEVLDR